MSFNSARNAFTVVNRCLSSTINDHCDH